MGYHFVCHTKVDNIELILILNEEIFATGCTAYAADRQQIETVEMELEQRFTVAHIECKLFATRLLHYIATASLYGLLLSELCALSNSSASN